MNDDWSAQPTFPSTPDRASAIVHVVRIPLDTDRSQGVLRELLSDHEQARADQFIRTDDRRRFTIAHAAVRVLLSRYLQCDPCAIRFGRGEKGKPFVTSPRSDVEFNLSHSGERALVAIGESGHIGVDIEAEWPRDGLVDLAIRFFSPIESASLERLCPSQRLAAFYRCWTRKESFIKASGNGLSSPLATFAVRLDEVFDQQLLLSSACGADVMRWNVGALPIDSGFAAAITVEGLKCVRRWRLDLDP
jgi:4'-phosphopantetheinyl transferase